MKYDLSHKFNEKQSLRKNRNVFLTGLFSLIWLGLRTGTKPSRAVYPCQRAAAANSYLWITVCILPFLLALPSKISNKLSRKKMSIIILSSIIIGSAAAFTLYEMRKEPQDKIFSLSEILAISQPSSDIFVVDGTSGNDGGIVELIYLMGKHNLFFYKSSSTGMNSSPAGLIAKDDIILVKVNSQWPERGGTNTDLLKALIQAILAHPDGFNGEIIIADNGQGRGSLDWESNNAEDTSQSVQKVVDSFSGSGKVSTYLWDEITAERVDEYFEGNTQDGFVVNSTADAQTGLMVSYPKFKTKFGTFVSFKLGIWDPVNQAYDNEKLKLVNMPVLKSHSTYGVTACVKHYMGVVSEAATARLGASSHQAIGKGGMGTEMAETRFPTLNILDAIYVNPVPGKGPYTSYATASRIKAVAASTDPVALDYWASKYILFQVARINRYADANSMNPDSQEAGSFGYWLALSMREIKDAGYQTTLDESHMNVFVQHFSS